MIKIFLSLAVFIGLGFSSASYSFSQSNTSCNTKYVSANKLNIRDKPNGLTIGSLVKGASVCVTSTVGSWSNVSNNVSVGQWVHTDYLTSQKPLAKQKTSVSKRIAVPSDPRAKYFLIDKTPVSKTGIVIITTSRQGPSGKSFARRRVNCYNNTFKYIGDGDTWEEMLASKPSPRMGKLVRGSISYYISNFACK